MAKGEERELKQSFPRELLDQSSEARLDYFKAYTAAHPFLEKAKAKVRSTLREPGGASLIFIIGPTGVGKTTLLTSIEHYLLTYAQEQLLQDPDRVPVIKLDAMAPSARQFRWPDFYTRALMAVSEPLIDYKVERGAVLPVFNERMGRHVPPRLIGDAAALQRSWEQVLKYRRPEAILIDEAHYFAKTAGGNRLEDQLDHVKSLAIATKTIHILAGTYDLLLFRNLNAELSRRSIDVHLPRYEATNPEERKAFQRALLTFQRHLPLEKAPHLVQQWEICYAHTVGCVGILKDWLTQALSEALETGAKTISPSLLTAHAPSVDRCHQMITDIEEGEKALQADPEATERLLARLGLGTSRAKRTRTAKEAEQPGPSSQSRRKRVGQRNPTRDAVKKEEAADG